MPSIRNSAAVAPIRYMASRKRVTMPEQASTEKQPAKGKPLSLWLLLALGVIVLDQLTKWYFNSHLAYGERWQLLPFFDFTLLFNTGAAFSFLASGEGWQRWLFTVIALAAAALI